MRTLAIIVALVLASLTSRAETIDRVVATVNGRPILQSDVDESVRCQAFIEGKSLSNLSAADIRAELDRLIDQELLRQQMGNVSSDASHLVVEEKLDEVRKQRAASPQQWREELAHYGIDENILAARLQYQLRTLGFVERRLRPGVVIDRATVESYYRDEFLPQLHKAGATQEPPLADVQQEIREILTQQHMDEMLTSWLKNLRQQSRVRVLLNQQQVATSATAASGK